MNKQFESQTSENPRPSDGLPNTIYKYRNWANEYNQKILTNREIYFSAADDFNDPFDSKFPIRYDLIGDDELKQRLANTYLRGKANASPAEVEEQVLMAFNNLRNADYLNDLQERKYAVNNEVIGVFSLTTQPTNILMWSHYSNSHKGFVVGFDTDSLFTDIQCTILPINYQNEYPSIPPGLGTEEGPLEIYGVYGTKSGLWEYEDEVRMIKVHGAKKSFQYKPETLKEVILGCKISEKHRDEILGVARNFPNVQVYQARMSRTAFELDIQPVNHR
jgi:hypothetical protein